jgi:cytochrome c oxidase subunit I
MFTVGMNSYANSFFAITAMAIGVPTGIKIFNWIRTMWGGRIQFKVPMLFCSIDSLASRSLWLHTFIM